MKENGRALLQVSGLRTYFFTQRGRRVVKAVDEVSFTLKPGESLALVGESGCGKTTTALSILRVLPPAAKVVGGEVWFDGEDLLHKSPGEMRRIRGKKIAMILQDPSVSLNPLFTVGEQIAEPLRLHQGLRGRGLRERISQLLGTVRIPSPQVRMREYPHQMSGGMKQRIVGAMALAGGPRVIIADEPTTNLDVTIQAQYLKLLQDLQESTGVALLFITHNLGIVAKMCHQVAVMYAGKIVERAPVRTLFRQPRHPYSIALLQSVPKIGHQGQLYSIPGQPPDLAQLQNGCAFALRCLEKGEGCRPISPPEVMLDQSHWVSCWKVG